MMVQSGSLQAVQQMMSRLLAALAPEVELLRRTLYKNRNQHGSSLHFQALRRVMRSLRLLNSLELPRLLSLLLHPSERVPPERLRESGPSKGPGEPSEALSQTPLPPAAAGAPMLGLLGAVRLLEQAVPQVRSGARAVGALLAQSFFMPLALSMLACMARCHLLLLQLLQQAVRAYNEGAALLAAAAAPLPQPWLQLPGALPSRLDLKWHGALLRLRATEQPALAVPPPADALWAESQPMAAVGRQPLAGPVPRQETMGGERAAGETGAAQAAMAAVTHVEGLAAPPEGPRRAAGEALSGPRAEGELPLEPAKPGPAEGLEGLPTTLAAQPAGPAARQGLQPPPAAAEPSVGQSPWPPDWREASPGAPPARETRQRTPPATGGAHLDVGPEPETEAEAEAGAAGAASGAAVQAAVLEASERMPGGRRGASEVGPTQAVGGGEVKGEWVESRQAGKRPPGRRSSQKPPMRKKPKPVAPDDFFALLMGGGQ